MRKLLTSLFVVLAIIINTSSLKAQQVMGSHISWTCVGQDSFLVSLTYYRDCNGVNPGSASIIIKCATTGSTITTLSIAKPLPIDITPTCASSCTRCETPSCAIPYGIDKYVYTKLVVLSSAGSCCKIVMSFITSLRKSSITTGAANKMLYIDAELDRCLSPCDNSPVFTNSPISIICIGQDLVYNHGVVDTDRDSNGGLLDSIAYEWTSPLESATSSISYTGQYAYDKPIYFWGFPNVNLPFPRGFHLDPSNGNISFKPMKIEQTVMVLKVSEWRKINGTMTKIGVVTRDIQVIVLACPNNNASVLGGSYYKEVCVGETVNFSIATNDYDTKDTLRISWNHAIANASWSANNDSVKHPTGTLSWTPAEADAGDIPYSFTVTVKDDACPINGRSTRAYQILVKPLPKAAISIIDSGCGNYFLNAQATLGENLTYIWTGNFNPGFVKKGSNIQYSFSGPGVYPIVLQVEAQQCYRTYFDTVVVDTFSSMSITPDFNICYGDTAHISVNYSPNSEVSYYDWNTGHQSQNISIAVLKDSVLSVIAYDTNGKCLAKENVNIDMHFLPVVNLGTDQAICHNSAKTIQANYTLGDFPLKSIYWYNKTDSLVSISNQLTISDSGYWRCVVTDTFGCAGEDTVEAIVNAMPSIKFQGNIESCIDGPIINLNNYLIIIPSNGTKTWTSQSNGLLTLPPGDKFNPLLAGAGSHKVVIEIEDPVNGCKTKDSSYVLIHPKPYTDAGLDTEICTGDGKFPLLGSPVTPPGSWRSLNGVGVEGTTGAYEFNPNASGISDGTTYHCAYKYTDSNGCINEDTVAITVYETPNVIAGDTLTIDVKDGIYHLSGTPAGGTWSGPGVSNNDFFPVTLGSGIYTLYYQYINVICYTTDSVIVVVVDEVGITESQKSFIRIYPNPANNELTVNLVNKDDIINHLYIYNTEGKLVSLYQNIAQNMFRIKDLNAPDGLYFIKVESYSGITYYHKIIIKN